MLDFQKIDLNSRDLCRSYLAKGDALGCEYAFANLYMWGRQRVAFLEGHMVLFSQFSRRSVYPWPVGSGDVGPVLDAIIEDAAQRGIPCRITSLSQEKAALLQQRYPGRFRIHADRDSYDYVYAIDDLADLKGRKYQRKRNHFNRFCQNYPNHAAVPMTEDHLDRVRQFVAQWYDLRQAEDPSADFHMEKAAVKRALDAFSQLDMEGMLLMDGDRLLAITLGSPLSEDTFDVHFEKALPDAEGAYAAVNCLFARQLRRNHPSLQFLNREDDLGLEGLRKAKLSYLPHHLVEKSWACLLEDGCEY